MSSCNSHWAGVAGSCCGWWSFPSLVSLLVYGCCNPLTVQFLLLMEPCHSSSLGNFSFFFHVKHLGIACNKVGCNRASANSYVLLGNFSEMAKGLCRIECIASFEAFLTPEAVESLLVVLKCYLPDMRVIPDLPEEIWCRLIKIDWNGNLIGIIPHKFVLFDSRHDSKSNGTVCQSLGP